MKVEALLRQNIGAENKSIQVRALTGDVETLLSAVETPHLKWRLERLRLALWLTKGDDYTQQLISGHLKTQSASSMDNWANAADLAMLWTDELIRRGHNKVATATGKQVQQLLVRHPLPRDLLYMVVKKAYLRGQARWVIETIDTIGEQHGDDLTDLNLAWLKARAWSALYWEPLTRGGKRTPEDEAQIREAATQCNLEYERALALAPSAYVKLQIAHEWMAIRFHWKFRDRSRRLMAAGLPRPLDPNNVSESERVRLEGFSDAVLDALKHTDIIRKMDDAHLRLWADNSTKILEAFGVEWIPEDVWRDILAGVSTYWKHCVAVKRLSTLDNEAVSDTFAWYLWWAIIRPEPDRWEREFLDCQVDEDAAGLEQAFSLAWPDLPDCVRTPSDDADVIRKLYVRFRHDRFFPYWKRAMLPVEREWAQRELDFYWAKIRNQRKCPAGMPEAAIVDYYGDTKRIYISKWLWGTTFHVRPGVRHLPGWWVRTCESTVTGEWISAFMILRKEKIDVEGG